MGIRRKNVELTDEQKKWNKMWQLWETEQAASPYAELMTYQGEINNGGHDQYFYNLENAGVLQKELPVLEAVLLETLKQNLKTAYATYLVLQENEDDEAAEETLEQCDDVFYENEAQLDGLLKEYAATIEL